MRKALERGRLWGEEGSGVRKARREGDSGETKASEIYKFRRVGCLGIREVQWGSRLRGEEWSGERMF